jgi:hypothetical protein
MEVVRCIIQFNIHVCKPRRNIKFISHVAINIKQIGTTTFHKSAQLSCPQFGQVLFTFTYEPDCSQLYSSQKVAIRHRSEDEYYTV